MNELPLGVLELLLSVSELLLSVSELLLSVSELLLSVLVDPEFVFVSEVDEPDDEGLLLLSVLAM